MNAYLNPAWPHIHQIAEVTRMVSRKGTTTTQVASLITDLSHVQAPPNACSHWSIENGSHYVRDVTFGEASIAVPTRCIPRRSVSRGKSFPRGDILEN